MAYYSDEQVEEIRLKNDIVEVISGYVRLQKKGSSYFGLCPFHNEKSPSFSVVPNKQMYYCFGCGAGGNVFTFIMEYEKYTFQEALQILAQRVGIDLPEAEDNAQAKAAADKRTSILELNKKAAKYFYMQLRQPGGSHAMSYLIDRKLSNDTMKKFGLGYANKYSNDLYNYLKQEGYSDTQLKEAGLVNVDEVKGMYDKFWNRVIFPIMDVNNRVIGFGGRVMGEGKPKYLNSPETKVFDKSRNLYGLNIARTSREKTMIICEGYMDVIALHQAGFNNAVASLGTAFTSGQASLIKRYTNEVILAYDSDSAGTKAALRAIPILKEYGLTAKVVNMNPYKDPDDFIEHLGAEELRIRIGQASNSFLYELEILEMDYDMKDPESKTLFYNEVGKRLVGFREELERNNYIEAVAEKYQMGFENLRTLVNHFGTLGGIVKETTTKKSGIHENKKREDGMRQSQKLLLTWLIEDQNLYRIIKSYIGINDFTEPLFLAVAEKLFAQFEQQTVNPAQIISTFLEEEEQREVASLFNATLRDVETKQEREKALKETIVRIKQNSIAHASKNLNATDMVALQRLVEDKRSLETLEKVHISIN